jgi:hypothetical protein
MRTVCDELVILFGTPAEAERAARALGIVDREIRPVRFVAPRTGGDKGALAEVWVDVEDGCPD